MTKLELRDKDRAILQAIQEGLNDTQKITEHTTLKNHQVRYALKKLQQQGLITLEKPDGMIEREINGQKRVFQAPWKSSLTENGLQTLQEADERELEQYQNLSHRELVEKIHGYEDRISRLETAINMLKNRVQQL